MGANSRKTVRHGLEA